MNLMSVARIAKVIALLAFVLPWVAVSCQNVDVATASGIELIQGRMSENPDAGKQMAARMGLPPDANAGSDASFSQSENLGLNFFGLAAAGVIVIGLALSFAGKGKTAARNVLITSLLAAALAFGTVWWWKEQVKGKAGSEGGADASASSPFGGPGAGNPFGGGGEMGVMGQNMMNQMLQERFGYWICLIALLVAAGSAALVMAPPPGPAKPGDQPPAG